MCKYFPGFAIHVPNGNHRKEHQSRKNGKWLKPGAKNHNGSTGSMVAKGAINIFSNSIEKYNFKVCSPRWWRTHWII